MKRAVAALSLLLFCSSSGGAEVRILNYSGERLRVDVLHSAGESRDVEIPNDVAVSEVIGPPNERGVKETLVVKTAGGRELRREKVRSQQVLIVRKTLGGDIFVSPAGYYAGEAEKGTLKILNATGNALNYSYETPGFQRKSGTLDNDFPALNARDIGDKKFQAEDDMRVTFGVNEDPNGEPVELKAGHVYFAAMIEGELVLTEIAVD